MFIFVLISGIVIWMPRTAKAWKNSFKISVNKGWRRFWYDLHIAGGLYTFLFLLVMSLTGLTWSFGWYRTGFYKVFGVETTQGTSHHGALSQTTEKEKGHRGEKNERGDAGNPKNGEITETTLYKDLDKSGKIRGWIFSVRVGSWGGMLTRILSFIAALVGGTLPLTGYYLWIKKEMGRSARKRKQ